jgi:hypothetical protein
MNSLKIVSDGCPRVPAHTKAQVCTRLDGLVLFAPQQGSELWKGLKRDGGAMDRPSNWRSLTELEQREGQFW